MVNYKLPVAFYLFRAVGRVISCVCDFVCLSVCVSALKGKRLESSVNTEAGIDPVADRAGARQALTPRSRGQSSRSQGCQSRCWRAGSAG